MEDQLQAEEGFTTDDATPELQAEVTETTESLDSERQDGADSTTASADEHEKITFDEGQQKVFDKAIGRQTHKAKEAERQAEQLRQELEEARKQIPAVERPVVPALPDDVYADDYADKMAARDEAIVQAAQFDANKQYQERVQQEQQAAQQRKQAEDIQANVDGYSKRAETLNVPKAELQLAAMKVQQAGMTMDLLREVTASDSGPLITMYLADNPSELQLMNQLSGEGLKKYMSAAVIPQLKAPTAKPSAPAPVDTIRGSGANQEHPALKGVQFT